MTDHDPTCPTCGAPTDPDPGIELDRITITRRLEPDGPIVAAKASDNITWYDAMAMIHIAADTIAQGALTGDDDD